MTAQEWLRATFGASDIFQVADPGDFSKYILPGIDPIRMPASAVTADTDAFLAYFGDAVQAALTAGTSLYAALTDGRVQDRGWRPYFELWKAKGIIS